MYIYPYIRVYIIARSVYEGTCIFMSVCRQTHRILVNVILHDFSRRQHCFNLPFIPNTFITSLSQKVVPVQVTYQEMFSFSFL